MKQDEVPQDESSLSKKNVREMLYATNDAGEYTTALSTGWDVKAIALEQSMDVIRERAEEAKQGFLAGELSPIPYFMEISKMDLNILASYVGLWKWRVKRHFKPKVFKTLSDSILSKYADAFEISVSDLKNFKAD